MQCNNLIVLLKKNCRGELAPQELLEFLLVVTVCQVALHREDATLSDSPSRQLCSDRFLLSGEFPRRMQTTTWAKRLSVTPCRPTEALADAHSINPVKLVQTKLAGEVKCTDKLLPVLTPRRSHRCPAARANDKAAAGAAVRPIERASERASRQTCKVRQPVRSEVLSLAS